MMYSDNTLLLKGFGKRIRELRKERKLSQSELGARANLEKSAVQRIERGYNSKITTLAKLANGLDVNISELMNFTVPLK